MSTSEHLCYDCRHDFPTCNGEEITWGIDRDPSATGADADTVLECDCYEPR